MHACECVCSAHLSARLVGDGTLMGDRYYMHQHQLKMTERHQTGRHHTNTTVAHIHTEA